MAARRTIKKGIYLGGALVVLTGAISLIVAGVVSIRSTPTPVATAPPFDPIILEQAVALPHSTPSGGRALDVIVQFRNPNARAGVENYSITVKVLDASGQELLTHQESTYLLPGSLQYVVITDLNVSKQASLGQVLVDVPDHPDIIELPDSVSIPQFQTFLRDRTDKQLGEQTLQTQTGLVRNSGTFDWQKVEVVAVGLDANRNIIAGGKTFLGRLLVNEQREFTVQWPKPEEPIQQVIVIPATNMFNEANIVEVLGNPSLLR